ncbi:MAG: hypothetical protein WCP28_20545, partial [Actinomycetes bacterium]
MRDNIDVMRAMATAASWLVAAALAVSVGGCAVGATRTTQTPAPTQTEVSTPSGASTAPSTLPTIQPWQPASNDVQPEVKLRAARLIEAIGTWSRGQQGVATARLRVVGLGDDPELVSATNPLLTPATAAVTRVDFAQYGGILSDSASVLLVTEQWLVDKDGAITHTGTTFDVRLTAASPHWTITAVNPAVLRPPAATLTPQARAALANPRLTLPFAAQADIRSGTISATVLRTLNNLSKTHAITISILASGHPLDVFGTTRPSDHPIGHAVDISAIDGRPVSDRVVAGSSRSEDVQG